MSVPIIVADVGGFTLAWEKEQLKITVTNIRNHSSDGRISGILKIETTAPGHKPLLHAPAQFNFMAPTSREQLAKRLGNRFKEVDWYAVLEKMADEVITRVSLGEPVIDIDTSEDVQPPPWLLPPLLMESLPTLVYGDRGSAKSTLALAWSQVIALPWEDNPLGLDAPERSYPSLYLDWEVSASVLQWQAKKLQTGLCKSPFWQPYRRMSRPLASDIEAVRQAISKTKAEVLIIDSVGPACGGDLNATEPCLNFFSALSSLKITSLLLGHNAKNTEPGKRSAFGSSFFENEARNIWEIRALQEAGDETLEVGLFHRKSLPFYGKLKPFGYKLSFTATTTTIEPQNPEHTRGFEESLGLRRRIILHISDNGPTTAKDLCTGLQSSMTGVQNATKFLKKKGELRVFNDAGNWKWGLPLTSEAEQP